MKKRFWQNLGINSDSLAKMPERQVFMYDQIMSIEAQHEARETERSSKK